jgi:hypothetical protein
MAPAQQRAGCCLLALLALSSIQAVVCSRDLQQVSRDRRGSDTGWVLDSQAEGVWLAIALAQGFTSACDCFSLATTGTATGAHQQREVHLQLRP